MEYLDHINIHKNKQFLIDLDEKLAQYKHIIPTFKIIEIYAPISMMIRDNDDPEKHFIFKKTNYRYLDVIHSHMQELLFESFQDIFRKRNFESPELNNIKNKLISKCMIRNTKYSYFIAYYNKIRKQLNQIPQTISMMVAPFLYYCDDYIMISTELKSFFQTIEKIILSEITYKRQKIGRFNRYTQGP